MAEDPICGMIVEEEADLRVEHGGQTYYFCSPYCLEAFKKNPARFVKPGSTTQTGAIPERISNEEAPAIDPICGMTVEPSNAAGKHEHNGKAYYFCSQHCLTKFKEDPDKWFDGPRGGHMHGSPSHAEHAHREARATRQTPATDKTGRRRVHLSRWIRRCASPSLALARSAAWRWNLRLLRRRQRRLNMSARCIRRSFVTSPDRARSAGWP